MNSLKTGLLSLILGGIALAQAAAGFTALLNPGDFTGWKLAKTNEILDGKAEAANKRFTVNDGVLKIDPKVKGDLIIQTTREFAKDVHIQFEFKPDAKCNNDLFLRGIKFDISKANIKTYKVDEWNTLDIIVTGEMAEYKCNGESLKKVKTKPGKTPFGIRAEFGAIEIRKLVFKES